MIRYILAVMVTVCVFMSCVADARINEDFSLANSLKADYPQHTTLTVQDMDPKILKYLKKGLTPTEPGLVIADFNDDSQPDYACLLRAARKIQTNEISGWEYSYKLVVYLSEGNKHVKFELINMSAGPTSFSYISQQIGPLIVHSSRDGDKLLHDFKIPGIKFIQFETDSVNYYWDPDKKKFKSIGL